MNIYDFELSCYLNLTLEIDVYNFRDCIIIAFINSGTSLYAGFAIFSVLGFMAHEQHVDVKNVTQGGTS